MTRIAEQGDTRRSTGIAAVGSHRGERKFVTVMFVDIVQSAQFVAGADPEDADDRLLAALQAMIDAVQRFGGTVNQVLGDGIMALFGVPRAQEDHALRACLAAEAVHALTGTRTEGGEPDGAVAVRVGLSSGEVVVKRAENDFDLKYRVVGEAVYLAQRLEEAAPPGKTRLSRATLNLVAGDVSARPAGQVRLKPKSGPVEAFELVEVGFDHRGFKGLSRGAPTSFIGRIGDLEAMQRLMDAVEGGAGRALVVTGEAGIGKSRLVFEFLESVRDRWVAIFTCDLLPPGLARRHDPLAWLVRSLLPSEGKQSGEKLRGAVTELLHSLEIEGPYTHSAISEVLGLELKDPAWVGLDPPERLQVIVEAVSEVVCATSRRRPQVLVFEDFHWADTETRRFTEELAGRLSSARVLLIITARSHHDRVWASWPSTVERDLQPLSRTQTSELLDVLLGSDSELEDVKRLLVQKAEGNPFFLEECVRALEEAGSLIGAPGDYRLAVPVAELEIPGSVQGVLAERMDALPASDRALLLRASVIGQRVDVGLLKDLQRRPREDLLARLERLQQAGFLERTRIMPNLEYSFRHALTHDVAYGTLLKRSRRYLHARVMAAIEHRRIEQLPGKVELLAYHALNAEDLPRAYAYCRRAGQHAQARSANQEAVDYFERSLGVLSQNPRTRRFRCREIDTRLELVQSLFPLGRHDQVHQQLLAAQSLASEIGDERRLANVTSSLVLDSWVSGDLERAILMGKKALEMAERLMDPKLEIQVGTRLGSVFLDRGDYESACKLLGATIKKIPGKEIYNRFRLLVIASVGSRTSLARGLGELGRFEDAIKIGDEGIRIAEDTGHVFSQIYAYLFVGNALLRKGDFERSLPPLSRSYELCSATPTKLLFPLSAASLGYAHVRLGNPSRGLDLLQKATEAAERRAIKFQLSQEFTWLGEAYLLTGDHKSAKIYARNALKRAKENGEKGDEAWSLWLLGEIHSHLDSTGSDDPEDYLYKAHDIAVTLLMSPLAAHIEFALGKLYLRRNEREKALTKLESAVSLYRDLGMKYWLKDAEAVLVAAMEKAPVSISLN